MSQKDKHPWEVQSVDWDCSGITSEHLWCPECGAIGLVINGTFMDGAYSEPANRD